MSFPFPTFKLDLEHMPRSRFIRYGTPFVGAVITDYCPLFVHGRYVTLFCSVPIRGLVDLFFVGSLLQHLSCSWLRFGVVVFIPFRIGGCVLLS